MSIATNLGRLLLRAAPLMNAPVAAIAASPRFGGALRRSNIALVTYTGRRSGRTFSIPVAYRRRDDETIDIGANLPDAKTWWRNFLGDGAPVTVTIDGVERAGHGVAHRDDKGRVTVQVRLAGS
jgi:F420H(2)-dependent quinone reductase